MVTCALHLDLSSFDVYARRLKPSDGAEIENVLGPAHPRVERVERTNDFRKAEAGNSGEADAERQKIAHLILLGERCVEVREQRAAGLHCSRFGLANGFLGELNPRVALRRKRDFHSSLQAERQNARTFLERHLCRGHARDQQE